jgi:hypothetical protein
VLRGQAAQCDGHVLWPAAARLSVGDSHGRPQLRVAVHAPVAEAVTVFCPRRPGDAAPSFTCERTLARLAARLPRWISAPPLRARYTTRSLHSSRHSEDNRSTPSAANPARRRPTGEPPNPIPR